MKYIITAQIDLDQRNTTNVFETNNKKELKAVYKKLQRLNDLQFPQSETLKQEEDELKEELSDKYNIYLWNYSEEPDDYDWELIGMFETKEVKM